MAVHSTLNPAGFHGIILDLPRFVRDCGADPIRQSQPSAEKGRGKFRDWCGRYLTRMHLLSAVGHSGASLVET